MPAIVKFIVIVDTQNPCQVQVKTDVDVTT